MSVGVPVTDWRATSGNGELDTASGNLITLSGLQLVTLSGSDLVLLGGSFVPVPANIWGTVETIPASIWQPTGNNDEFSSGGVYDIADPAGVLLVDTAGVQVVDTGVINTPLDASIWEEDDSK